ncbi:hypothetical protein Leryth_012911 [Lithospermum erythrorhizon]|nr:hypothetical protein Leryth_012911 [Lithospermum erythrorhizon]
MASLINVIKLAMLSLSLTTLTTYQATSIKNQLHPLILIPGNGGNQLEARLTSDYKPSNLLCKLYTNKKDKDGWFRLWFDPSVLLAPFTKCFAERMTLYYDPILDDYCNAPGVETRVSNFGSTQSLLYLDPNLQGITTYMASLVESLEQIGYTDGENLFGAPYDFRYGLAPEGHPCQVGSTFLDDLKTLVEIASSSNGGKRVILLSHSLGGLYVLEFLNRSPLAWRQKYIKHFIALSAPWGGTVEEMLVFASGSTLGVPLVDPLLVRDEQRSSESNLWLMPSPYVFSKKTPLVITPNTSYSAHEITRFLQDIGYPEGVDPYITRIVPLAGNLTPTEVPITCIFGSGVATSETLFYGDGGFDKQPEIIYGDGDGTVNMVSLMALESAGWGNKTSDKPIKVIKIPGISHTSILKEDIALVAIIGEINYVNSNNTISVLKSG